MPVPASVGSAVCRLTRTVDGEVKVVNDQIGQPTSARDLAKQVKNLALSEATFGVYHGTNSGSATWFDFAREIFILVGADYSRLTPVTTAEFPRPAKRPSYSVLSHKNWNRPGLEAMRDWKEALAEEIPLILSEIRKEA